jgi:hypothetical protein
MSNLQLPEYLLKAALGMNWHEREFGFTPGIQNANGRLSPTTPG